MAPMYLDLGRIPSRLGSSHPTLYPYNAFLAADGYVVVTPFTQRFWRNFCIAIGRPELAEDPAYADFTKRLENRTQLAAILDNEMRRLPVAEWLARFRDANVPAGPVNSVGAALDMEQTRA